MIWLLFCMALATTSASNCDICLKGHCLGPDPLNITENDKVPPNSVDINNNILYYIRHGSIESINLDNYTVNLIPTVGTFEIQYLTIDQITGELYNEYYDRPYYRIYKGQTQIDVLKKSKDMWSYNATIYWINSGKELCFVTETSSPLQTVAAFRNIKVKSVTFDKFRNMYITTKNEVYKQKPNEDKSVLLLGLELKVLRDINGDVYVIDSHRHGLIYQVDSETDKLDIVGAFGAKYNNYEDYMLDKYNNIIAKKQSTNLWFHFKDKMLQCRVKFSDKYRIGVGLGNIPQIEIITPNKNEENPYSQ